MLIMWPSVLGDFIRFLNKNYRQLSRLLVIVVAFAVCSVRFDLAFEISKDTLGTL